MWQVSNSSFNSKFKWFLLPPKSCWISSCGWISADGFLWMNSCGWVSADGFMWMSWLSSRIHVSSSSQYTLPLRRHKNNNGFCSGCYWWRGYAVWLMAYDTHLAFDLLYLFQQFRSRWNLEMVFKIIFSWEFFSLFLFFSFSHFLGFGK